MKVNGKEIEQSIVDACLARMKKEPFKAIEIEGICSRMGIETLYGTAMRVADRIIQRERKAGNIELSNRPFWAWVGGNKEQA